MSGNEAWNRKVLDADGRLTETGQIAYHAVRQTVPNSGSGDWEGPAADGRQFHGRHQQSGGNVDQADRRREPVDAGMVVSCTLRAWPTYWKKVSQGSAAT